MSDGGHERKSKLEKSGEEGNLMELPLTTIFTRRKMDIYIMVAGLENEFEEGSQSESKVGGGGGSGRNWEQVCSWRRKYFAFTLLPSSSVAWKKSQPMFYRFRI